MAKTKDEDFVTFLNSAGEVISNDPRYRAKKLLEASGDSTSDDGELREALSQADQRATQAEQEAESLKQQLAALQAQVAATSGVDDEAEEEDDAADEDEFTSMNGKELKAYAKENNVDISGMTKVGEVRTALRAAKSAAE